MTLHFRPIITFSLVVSLLFVLFLTGVVLYSLWGPWFKIKKITCSIDSSECPDYLQAELAKNLSHSLFFTNYDQIVSTINRFQPNLITDSVTKNLQGEVQFTFHKRQPQYAIKSSQTGTFVIDESGVITDVVESSTLPQLTLSSQNLPPWLTLGTQVPVELHNSTLSCFAALQKLEIPYTSVTLLTEDEVEIQLSDGKKAVVLLSKVHEELPKLQFLLRHQDLLESKGTFHLIDLRFKYPVLKT